MSLLAICLNQPEQITTLASVISRYVLFTRPSQRPGAAPGAEAWMIQGLRARNRHKDMWDYTYLLCQSEWLLGCFQGIQKFLAVHLPMTESIHSFIQVSLLLGFFQGISSLLIKVHVPLSSLTFSTSDLMTVSPSLLTVKGLFLIFYLNFPPIKQKGFHWFHWDAIKDKVTPSWISLTVIHLEQCNTRFSHSSLYFFEIISIWGAQCMHCDWPLSNPGLKAMR